MSLGKRLTTFWRVAKLLPWTSTNPRRTPQPLETRALRSFETSRITHSATQQHIVVEPSHRINSVQVFKRSDISIRSPVGQSDVKKKFVITSKKYEIKVQQRVLNTKGFRRNLQVHVDLITVSVRYFYICSQH